MRRLTSKFNGFTLIEVLVVIAIIAILTAILFPVFSKAREKGRQGACMSNMKQIGLAVLQYTQDYDEMEPGYIVGTSPIVGWRTILNTYVKSQNVFLCPSNTYNNKTVDWDTAPGWYRSYAVNPVIMPDLTDNPSWGVSLAKLQQPTQTFIVGESVNNNAALSAGCDQFQSNGVIQSYCVPGPTVPKYLFAGHTQMSNWLFCDGHVKSMRAINTCNATTDIWMLDVTWSPALPCDATLQADMATVDQQYQ